MIEAIIFDLDGVLVTTDEYHYLAWKRIADELGVPFDRTVNDRLRGVSRMESLGIVLSQSHGAYSEEEKNRLAQRKNEIYVSCLSSLTPGNVEREVTGTLLALKSRGLKLAVGSSSKNAKYILEKTGLAEYFDAVADGNSITRSKPDPEVFIKASLLLGTVPSRCAVIEDAVAGIRAAVSGGFLAIGLGSAASCKMANYAIGAIDKIIGLVDSLNAAEDAV